MQKIGFAEALDSIVATDPRYARDAYVFLRDALDFTTKQQKKIKGTTVRHVAGPELNGHTTAQDLGLGRMLKKRGDFIGRVLAERPGMTDPLRPRLVGLRAVEPTQPLRAGAHLIGAEGAKSLGWISSVTRSVADPGWIGLGLLRDGETRIGSRMIAASPLTGEEVPVAIASPHMYDPENARVRG